jgi:hypothetical protein
VAGAARARVDRGAGAAAIGLRLGVPARPARQERGEVIGERAHIVFGDAREVAHHRVHRAGGDGVLRLDAGAQVREELLAAPGQRRGVRRVQRGRVPAFGLAAVEGPRFHLGAQGVARRVAGAAVREAFGEIRAPAPLGVFPIWLEIKRLPSAEKCPDVVGEAKLVRRRACAHRLARHEIGVERADVLVGEPRVVLVGKRGIEMPALAVQALAQRAPERGLRPGSDPGFGLGGDVGAVDRAEGRPQRPAAQRCKLRALAHQSRFERRRRRRLDRRERLLRGTSRDAEQRRGAKSLYHLRKRPPPPKNSRKRK